MKTKRQIADHIRMLIEEISLGATHADHINDNDRLIADIGLDSLDYAGVLLGCERWMEIKVQEDNVDWGRITTVDQLASFLMGQQPRQLDG